MIVAHISAHHFPPRFLNLVLQHTATHCNTLQVPPWISTCVSWEIATTMMPGSCASCSAPFPATIFLCLTPKRTCTRFCTMRLFIRAVFIRLVYPLRGTVSVLICIYIYKKKYVYIYTCMCICICPYMYARALIHKVEYICTYIHIYTCINMYLYIYIIHMDIYLYIYTYIYEIYTYR